MAGISIDKLRAQNTKTANSSSLGRIFLSFPRMI